MTHSIKTLYIFDVSIDTKLRLHSSGASSISFLRYNPEVYETRVRGFAVVHNIHTILPSRFLVHSSLIRHADVSCIDQACHISNVTEDRDVGSTSVGLDRCYRSLSTVLCKYFA